MNYYIEGTWHQKNRNKSLLWAYDNCTWSHRYVL